MLVLAQYDRRVPIELPDFIEPMHPRLARTPIEDERYSCELKWDGVRAQIHVERGRYRMLTRSRRDVTGNYPEFSFLSSLPTGTVIDAEIVVMDGERPSFHRVMVRDRAARPATIAGLMGTHPAKLVAFDLLYERGRCVMDSPLHERRDRLRTLIARASQPAFVF